MKKIILTLLLISTQCFYAQYFREIHYGIFAGGIHSTMSNLPNVIVPNGMYTGYSLQPEGKFGALGGFFISFKYPYANVSIQPEVFFSQQSTDLNYKDIKDLNYKMTFDYSYINIGASLKYYIAEGFYIGAGPYVGFNIASNNIKYTSNAQSLFSNSGATFESDKNVQKVLRESLTGKNYFYAMFSTGYEFTSNLSINLRYTLGLTDALMTEENGHRYSENKNKINSISLTIGYSFDFDNLDNF